MKLSKTFRLSESAVAILDKQSNATEYIENLILGGTSTNKDEVLDKITSLDNKIKQALEIIIKSQGRGTTLDQPTERKVYNGKYFVGVEEVKPPGCLCPYERNERGLIERSMTSLECPIHA